MITLKRIDIDHTQDVAHLYVSDGDPSSDGLVAGVNSLATVIGGAQAGNVYRKDDVANDDWTLILDANA